jgi:large subunit ribosomal protein L18
MIEKKESRLRRSRATRVRIALQRVNRLTVNRTNQHIYASVLSADGGKVLVSASTVEPEVRKELASVKGKGGNANAEAGRNSPGAEGQGRRHRDRRF